MKRIIFALSLLSASSVLPQDVPSKGTQISSNSLTDWQLLTKGDQSIAQCYQALSLLKSYKISSVKDLTDQSLFLFENFAFVGIEDLITQLNTQSLALSNRLSSKSSKLLEDQLTHIQALLKDLTPIHQARTACAHYRALENIKQTLDARYARELASNNHSNPFFKKSQTNRSTNKLIFAGAIGLTGLAVYGLIKAWTLSDEQVITKGEEYNTSYAHYNTLLGMLTTHAITSPATLSAHGLRALTTEAEKMTTASLFVTELQNHSALLTKRIQALAEKTDARSIDLSRRMQAQQAVIAGRLPQLELLAQVCAAHKDYFELRAQYAAELTLLELYRATNPYIATRASVIEKGRWTGNPYTHYVSTVQHDIRKLGARLQIISPLYRPVYEDLARKLREIFAIAESDPLKADEQKQALLKALVDALQARASQLDTAHENKQQETIRKLTLELNDLRESIAQLKTTPAPTRIMCS